MDIRTATIELTEDALDYIGFKSFGYFGRQVRVEKGTYSDMGVAHSKKIELVEEDIRITVYFDISGRAWKITGMYKSPMWGHWEATPEIFVSLRAA
jgi:hypothetical protein